MENEKLEPSSKLRHLNKLRWLSLTIVFSMLIILLFVHLYQ